MNKLCLLAIFFLVASLSYGQSLSNKEVPSNLTAKVLALYPDAEKVEWEMEDGFYEASFLQNKQPTSVILSSQAVLVRTEVELDKAEWPSFIQTLVSAQPGSLKAEEVDMITDIYGHVTYEVEAGNMEFVIDAKGTLLSKEIDDDDDDQ